MITAAISSEDHLAALRLHRKRAVRRLLLVLAALAAAGAIAIAIGHVLIGAIGIGAGVGGLIGEFVQSRFALPRRARKIYQQQASLRATYTYSWDADGLSASSEAGHVRRRWPDYIKLLESDRLFLLYHSDIMFEIFPKSWFRTPEQIDEFRTLASRADAQ
ncbi:YcxB family protein [Luteimonas sp. RD2P54]|uniref:YcxB family protein n=1 Tax=Luteimonas endophytica TaxID=3042023 RepID=A0ABT6J586_9GAMM|nr:YcxB family protein [Luteimonas endophytica]MDH5821984.1 YcxB family protein [Luteimonas endophytica]